jgi:predicted RNase H-like nuclease (RuvC/YqgF family)
MSQSNGHKLIDRIAEKQAQIMRHRCQIESIIARQNMMGMGGDQQVKAADKIRHLYIELSDMYTELHLLQAELEKLRGAPLVVLNTPPLQEVHA